VSNKENWEKLFEKSKPEKDEHLESNPVIKTTPEDSSSEKIEWTEFPETYKTHQIQGRYILTNIASGIMIIDQKRAHTRILFESLFDSLEDNRNLSQQQLFPVNIKLTLSDAEILREIMEDVRMLGFSISESGKDINSFTISGTPAELINPDINDFIESFLEDYKRNLIDLNLDKRINLAASMATNMAMNYGKKLEQEEMSSLIDQLFACKSPEIGHEGKVIFRILKYSDIESWF